MTTELFVNTPHQAVSLNGAIATAPAAGTVETWAVTIAAVTGTQFALPSLTGGQLRFSVDTEMIIATAGTTAAGNQSWTVTRGADNTTPTTHASGASLTAKVSAASLTASTRPVVPSVYLPDGWDTGWKSAKANIATTRANLLFFGDSIPSGTVPSGATNYLFSATCGEILVASLRSKYTMGRYADFWDAELNTSIQLAGTDLPWTAVSGSFVADECLGWTNSMRSNAAIAGNAITFTAPAACTSMDILYMDMVAGTWVYTVDGGTPVTVTNTATATASALVQSQAQVKKISLTSLTNTTHTIVFSAVSASYTLVLEGVTTYSGATAGLAYSRLIASGARFYAISGISGTPYPASRWELWYNKSPQNDATSLVAGVPFADIPLRADLLIQQVFYNDVTQGQYTSLLTGPAYNLLRHSITAVRSQNPSCSIVFLTTHFGMSNYQWSDTALTVNNPSIGQATIRDLCDQFNCAWVNIEARWGIKPVASGFMTTAADPHWTAAGHADVAAALGAIL